MKYGAKVSGIEAGITNQLRRYNKMNEDTTNGSIRDNNQRLIQKIQKLFTAERNKTNQATFYKKMIVKFFGHDRQLLKEAADALGFWFKEMEGNEILLSYAISKENVKKYDLEKDI